MDQIDYIELEIEYVPAMDDVLATPNNKTTIIHKYYISSEIKNESKMSQQKQQQQKW